MTTRRSMLMAAIGALPAFAAGWPAVMSFSTASGDPGPAVSGPAAMPDPVAAGDFIGFHGGGPLLGEAQPLHAPPYKLRWKFRTDDDPAAAQPNTRPGHFIGAAAIVGSTVYSADTSGAVRAFDAATGKVRWTYRADDGFEITPLVIGNRVFAGDLVGMVHAIAADTGALLWKFDSGSAIHASANHLDGGKRIVFGNDGADIFCLDAATGKVIWNDKSGDRVNGAPAVADGMALISGCDAELRALAAADGKEQFTVDLGALCPGSVAAAGDNLVLGTDEGRVQCISLSQKKQRWLFDGVGEHAMVYSSPAVADGIAVVGARDRKVYGLNLADGKKIWSFATQGEVDSSPVISGGRVYVGSKDKKLYVLDLKSGKALWSFIAGRGIEATPAIGARVIVVGDTGGSLFCLE